ncbi:MAG: methionyl-tRNA formyltransferase [Patescibacteria group bacterium]|nr:methionyl-tRNA formyltransferase [Patescibacteria group bacterium]MDE2116402.1 methionyl-tRNA formyltransferase [Patescibacteria group bacterium]
MNKINFAFFGTPDRAVIALDELKKAGLVPGLIVTQPDRPQGRKLVLTPPPVKIWAERGGVPFMQPENLDDPLAIEVLRHGNFDAFVVVAYGKILKKEVLAIPRRGALNLHASLLPHLRGSSPIETAILNDERNTGATIILMDELVDHGPIIAQARVSLDAWPLPADELARHIVVQGGRLLAESLPKWVAGDIEAQPQDHSKATFTKKISKADGLIDPNGDGYQNFLKYNAYMGWPGTYFFVERDGKKTRINITSAAFENGRFVIQKVVPEGKKETAWSGS